MKIRREYITTIREETWLFIMVVLTKGFEKFDKFGMATVKKKNNFI